MDSVPDPDALLAFDFDGTLVSLAPRPSDIKVSPELRCLLLALAAQRRRTLICSGRAVRDLLQYVPSCLGLDLIGNHGLEWRLTHPGRAIEWRDRTPRDWKTWRQRSVPVLEALIACRGGMLEDKGASLSIHYRHSGTGWWSSAAASEWLSVLVRGPALLLSGTECWNILPVGVSKGTAIIQYASEFGFAEVVYFGDEPTDETVFRRSGSTGPRLTGVKVGEGPTAASFRIASVSEVIAWLRSVVDVGQGIDVEPEGLVPVAADGK